VGHDLRVAVVGAGIGGLTLGLALRERGIPARLYEQAPSPREVGAAVSLAANGSRLLDRLGLGAELAAVSHAPSAIVHRDARSGRTVARHPLGEGYRARFGGAFHGLHRVELQRILGNAWGADGLHLGRRVTGLTERAGEVRLEFADGPTETADLVIGADGVHSAVRRWMVGDDPAERAVYSGTSGFRGLVPVEALPSLPDPDAAQFWMGPGAHLLHYPIDRGAVVNFLFVVRSPREWTAPGWMVEAAPDEHLVGLDGWHPAVLEMIGAVPVSARWALFARPPLHRWSRGPVVLLGDAAHAMLPHHGQGANQTIEDAVVLADCLAGRAGGGAAGVTGALADYQRLRRARTRAVQRASWVAGEQLHLPDGPAAARRDRSLAGLPERIDWIHGHDAQLAAATR
jgi:salicylate hydroxylase